MESIKNKFAYEIPVMHCFDNNYVIPAAVSFYSMLENADPAFSYRLFVLHSDITVQNQQKLTRLVRSFKNADLEFLDMNSRFDDLWDDLKNTDHLSKEVLYKLLVPEIFPQYDTLIITDVDVAFLGDIAPSYRAFEGHSDAYFAGVRQINLDQTFLRQYYENYITSFSHLEFNQLKVCGGYLVANLKKLREDNMTEVFIDYLKSNAERLLQAEQDVINFCCREKQIVMLPLNYVVCSYMYDLCKTSAITVSDPYYTYREMTDAMEYPIQLHYATKTKPWNTPNSTKADIWYKILEKTEFLHDFEAQKRSVNESETQSLKVATPSTVREKPSVMVSIVVCSYNHEDYIQRTLQSIFNQKTQYSYEVIVADDASTDKTSEIIRSFQEKYPKEMSKSILRTSNVGIGRNYCEALNCADGKYLALCDGDDYWRDELKLQKQIDFLENNPEYNIICSDFIMHDINKNEEKPFNIKDYLDMTCNLKDTYTVRDLIFSRFVASCTVVFRWKLKQSVPSFMEYYSVIDFPLALIHASDGAIKVLLEPLSVYRIHGESITQTSADKVAKDTQMLLKEVNQFLDYKLTPQISEYMQSIKLQQRRESNLKNKAEIKTSSLKRVLKQSYRKLIPSSIRSRLTPVIRKVLRK